jgi:hypothetical protein
MDFSKKGYFPLKNFLPLRHFYLRIVTVFTIQPKLDFNLSEDRAMLLIHSANKVTGCSAEDSFDVCSMALGTVQWVHTATQEVVLIWCT